jgi:hypothetical protein
MELAFVESLLSYFETRVKVGGSTQLEKLKQSLSRWEKVIEDCEKSSDRSQYRNQFASAHKEPVRLLKLYLEEACSLPEDTDHSLRINVIKNKFLFLLRQAKEDSGYSDALAYIIIELERCTN